MNRDVAILIAFFNCCLAGWNLGRCLPWWWDEYVPVDRGLRAMTTITALWSLVSIGIFVWMVRRA